MRHLKHGLAFLFALVVVKTEAQTPPTASFVFASVCLGNATTFSDASVSLPGDPIVAWNWSFPGGVPSSSTVQNPVITYSLAGTHTVTLIVTTQLGYKDTLVQQVIVYNIPVANFSPSPSGGAMDFTDLSTSQDGPIVSWKWTFPGGTPGSSNVNNPSNILFPPGTYTPCLTVTSNYGCVDSLCQTLTVLGIEENYLSSAISILPSISSSGIFTISVSSPLIHVLEVEAFDIVVGKVDKFSINKATMSLEMAQKKNGIYLLRISTDAGTVTKRVVLSR